MDDKQREEPYRDSEAKAPNIPELDDEPTPQKTQSINTDPQYKIEKLETTIKIDQWIMIGLTAAIALAGFLQYRAMSGQLKEMQSGGADTHELAVQAKNQADAAKAQTDRMAESLAKTDKLIMATNRLATEAKRSANIARDSLKVAQQSLEVQERPWVGVDAFRIRDNIEAGKRMAASVIVENAGNSPALHVEVNFQMFRICGDISNTHPPYGATTSSGITIIMPKKSAETTASKGGPILTEDDIKALKAPGCNLYAFTRITYRDIFAHHHWRHACGAWNQDAAGTFFVCPHYNDGDEDYPDGKEP